MIVGTTARLCWLPSCTHCSLGDFPPCGKLATWEPLQEAPIASWEEKAALALSCSTTKAMASPYAR